MKQIKLTFLFLLSFVCSMAYGGEVTEQEALLKAQQFMPRKTFKAKSLNRSQKVGNEVSKEAFYVFNAEQNGGYVIVSADDRTVPILGYSDKGKLDLDNMPENMRAWLQGYTNQIKSLGVTMGQEHRTAPVVIGSPIAPLITSHWGQNEPYNNLCPMDGELRSVTGCVATAMAQILYYHKWPQVAVPALPAYTTSTKQISVEPLTSTTFKWDLMKDEYEEDETGDAADAVAELMRYCGQSVRMDYTNYWSASSVCASKFIYDFGYSKTAKSISRSNYSTTEWEQLLYNELANNRPIMYSGCSMGALRDFGHQFIVDGYDDQGLFHVNWGWDGDQDGYFSLSILNLNITSYLDIMFDEHIAAQYTGEQAAIVGIQPNHGEEGIPIIMHRVISNLDDVHINTITRSGTDQDFDLTLHSGRYPIEGLSETFVKFDHAFGLYKDGALLEIVEEQDQLTSHYPANINDVTVFNDHIVFGKNLPDGDYWLIDLYRKDSNSEWQRSSSYYAYFIIASIEGNTLRLKRSTDLEDEVHVNDIQIHGAYKVARGMYAVVNWTNNGYRNENYFRVWFNDQKIGDNCSFIEHGETGEVTVFFLPTEAGTGTLKITANDNNTVIWSSVVNITPSLTQQLSVTITVEGENNGTIEGNSINATFAIKNTGENVFDDNVALCCTYPTYLSEEKTKYVLKHVSLEVGEEKSFEVDFSSLETGQKYALMAYYYEQADYKPGPNNFPGAYTASITPTDAKEITTGGTLEIDGIYYKLNSEGNIAEVKTGKYEGDIVIPSTVTYNNVEYSVNSIADGAFYNCGQVTSVYIPKSVTTIGDGAFYGCSLNSIIIETGNSVYDSRNNCNAIIETATNTLIQGFKTTTIPNSITTIGDRAFTSCYMTSITIPSSVTSIGNEVFVFCWGLTDVYCYAEKVPQTGNGIFAFSNVKNATLHVPAASVDAYSNAEQWKDFGTIVGMVASHQLKYMVDGEEYKVYEIEEGATITPETAPTKEGYTFSGWSEIPETMPAHDVTITGSFSINSYKLTYMIDNEVYKNVTYEYGATITPEPTPEGNYATFEWTDLPQTMPAHDVVVHATYTTGITDILKDNQQDVKVYSPNGKMLAKPEKGINIIRTKDRTTKKVVVK